MWIRLGRYEHDDAMELASWLEKSKIRCEVKSCIDWGIRERYYVKGRLSELRSFGKEVEEWEKYIQITRKLLMKPVEVKEFEEKLLSEVNPERHAFIKKCREIMGDKVDFSKLEKVGITAYTFVEEFWAEHNFILEVFDMLRMNSIEVNDIIKGELPEDPQLIVELKEYRDGVKTLYELELFRVWEVYVDTLSITGNFDEEFKVRYWDEFILLASAASMISSYISFLSKKQESSIDELKNLEKGYIGGEAIDVAIEADGLTEEIVKALKEAGLVSRRGDTVIWKG